MNTNGLSEYFAFQRTDVFFDFKNANNINAGHVRLIVHSRAKLLHIFEETDERSHFIYRS